MAGWYPPFGEYYVQNPNADEYPVRQGDVMRAPEGAVGSRNRPWRACVVVHPSCEITAKQEPARLHVIRVYRLAEAPANRQEQVVQGMALVDGAARVAMAHTFCLAPIDGFDDEPLWADFRQLYLASRDELTTDHRLAALTHDTRVAFIRRKLYWEQRWALHLGDVYALEANRIRNDGAFIGPKPSWAQ